MQRREITSREGSMTFWQWSAEHPWLFVFSGVVVVMLAVIAGETVSSAVRGWRR